MSQRNEIKKYWFPAKKYGWGWGFPSTWQGWITLLIYIGTIVLTAYYLFPPEEKPVLFVILTMILSGVFVMICWLKGEPQKSL